MASPRKVKYNLTLFNRTVKAYVSKRRSSGDRNRVMKPDHKNIEKIDQRLRIQPLRGGNLLYIT